MSDHPHLEHEPKRWLDHPANVRKVVWAIVAVCAGLFLADALYHKHPHFEAEEVFGFYALYGFVSFFGIVMAGKYLRKLIKRDEDYYDR
ncbi:MAG: hypothetical protein MJD61_15705 [Proteobacteria bacterium]|nr:hypothetical protein [Pseudomonadota bacterium]